MAKNIGPRASEFLGLNISSIIYFLVILDKLLNYSEPKF